MIGNLCGYLHLRAVIPEAINSQMTNYYRQYIAIGGMPEAVQKYIDTRDFREVDKIQRNLLQGYQFVDGNIGVSEDGIITLPLSLAVYIDQARAAIAEGEVSQELVDHIREVAIHYAKKGDLLYPHLKVGYQISGPSDVMWTVDDEIRDELAALSKKSVHDKEWMQRFDAVVTRVDEMIYKEQNILFPNCAVNFTEDEWIHIYHDAKDYADCLGVTPTIWEKAENAAKTIESTISDQEIVMPGGHMNVAQLTALLNTIPMEITFVDADNMNRFFNEGPKDFKRPGMAIDREVFTCHPPKIEAQVRRIIGEFRNGTLDEVPIWMEKNGKSMLVKYMAVRDKNQNYLGTLELVQNMDFAKEHFMKKERMNNE